jgi:hypothetical protein
MTDMEFDKVISGMTEPRTGVMLWSAHLYGESLAAQRSYGERVARGETRPYEPGPYALTRAAQELLEAAASESDATTVYDLAGALARKLDADYPPDHALASAFQEGFETVIREALRNEPVLGEQVVQRGLGRGYMTETGLDDGVGHPSWIAFRDEEGDWYRIPWRAARLNHLRFLADYRRQQARELQAKADQITALYELLQAAADGNPDVDTSLPELWAAARGLDEFEKFCENRENNTS